MAVPELQMGKDNTGVLALFSVRLHILGHLPLTVWFHRCSVMDVGVVAFQFVLHV